MSENSIAVWTELTTGSGPRRTPRRGAAGSDVNSSGLPHLPRVRKTSGNYAVEVAPDAHRDQRRPSCVRVCCRTRAPAPRFAPRPGPACYFVTTLNLLRSRIYTTARKLMSPHFNSLKCRRLGTAAIPDVQSALVRPPPALTGRCSVRRAARLPRCRRRGACPDIVGTILLL
ncbi:hypothetical protein EVAR_26105_1 [Eumeta japonica]|uniref:Uncharacterized protein n=1 Tax=Eumeta variegata TaxID=151549 RepID=A0A4C1X198_EUMVA|nr:hypothetical protein EVAR_26105_1 [Eumeta japonica]